MTSECNCNTHRHIITPISAPCCVLPCGLHLQYNLFYFFDSWWLMLLHHQCDVKQTWLLWLQRPKSHQKEQDCNMNTRDVTILLFWIHDSFQIQTKCLDSIPIQFFKMLIASRLNSWFNSSVIISSQLSSQFNADLQYSFQIYLSRPVQFPQNGQLAKSQQHSNIQHNNVLSFVL